MENKEEVLSAIQHNSRLITPVVVPILHYAATAKCASDWTSGGTGLLVNTGEMNLLITAAHVMEGDFGNFGSGEIVTLIGGEGFEPVNISTWNVIARCNSLDICTIEVPDEFNPETIGKRFCKPRNWPCQRVTRAEEAFFIGYPRAHRSGDSTDIVCGATLISEFVASVSGDRFVLVNEDAPRHVELLNGYTIIPEHFGGMSGAPVFVHRDDGWLEPVGLFVEGNGKDSPYLCAYLDNVLPNGSFTQARI